MISRYGKAGQEEHGKPVDSVMTVEFFLNGTRFIALNGGDQFKFNEAVFLIINCKDQEEVDYYCDKLKEGGDPKAQQCRWLKDKYGVSWQIVPTVLPELTNDPHSERSQRAIAALMKMKKPDIAALKKAYDGK